MPVVTIKVWTVTFWVSRQQCGSDMMRRRGGMRSLGRPPQDEDRKKRGKKVGWGVKGIQRGPTIVSDMGDASRHPANTHTHTCSRLGFKFYQQSLQL